MLTLAELLGFRSVPPMSAPIRLVHDLLRWHGPLWVHGQGHIVVFAGADIERGRVFVHDPWPVNVGWKG